MAHGHLGAEPSIDLHKPGPGKSAHRTRNDLGGLQVWQGAVGARELLFVPKGRGQFAGFSSLRGQLVAVAGPKGCGKKTLLERWAGWGQSEG